jgi:hypothetical protein
MKRVMDAGQKVKAFFDYYGGFEAIIIEHTVFMNSPKTAADLALVQGAILGAAGQSGTESNWQGISYYMAKLYWQ